MTYSVDQILSNDPAIDWRWAGREGLKRCTCQQLREWLRDKTGQAYSTTKKNDLVECVLVYAAKVDTAA